MENTEVVVCTKDDLPRIIEIINKCKVIYGIDIVESGIRDIHLKRITDILDGTDNKFVVGYKEDGILISFCVIAFADILPFWVANTQYDDVAHTINPVKLERNLIGVLRKCIEIAESRGIYSFYFVTRYSKLWKRYNILFLENFSEYYLAEVEVLEPYTKTKYPGIEKILGKMNGVNDKSIVVLQGLKPYTDQPLRLLHNQKLV